MDDYSGEFDEKPEELLKKCLTVCVKHPLESLSANPPVTDGYWDIDMDSEVQSTDGCKHILQLKTNQFIPEDICENLFQNIVKEYPEHYLNLFTNTSKCRLTRINLSTNMTKYPLSDGDLYSKLFFHPLQELNLSGCKLQPNTLESLKYCASSLRTLELSNASGLTFFSTLQELKQLQRLNLHNTDIGYSNQNMKYIASLKKLKWLDLSCTSIDDEGLTELLPLSR